MTEVFDKNSKEKRQIRSSAIFVFAPFNSMEWRVNMSQLYVGNKFASERHSRMYKHRKLAIKLISLPEEYGDLATFMGKQFTSEVALVKASRYHYNCAAAHGHIFTHFLYLSMCHRLRYKLVWLLKGSHKDLDLIFNVLLVMW